MSPYRRRSRLEDWGAQFGMGPAVTLLVTLNVVIFIFQMLTNTARGFGGMGGPTMEWFSFVPYFAIERVQLWRFVTYMFLHGGFWHVALNMFVLWMFGPRIEEIWGKRIFLIYYFVCGIGAALTYGMFSLVGMKALTPMVGASGAIYGLLLAYGVTYPDSLIYIFFVIPLRAKYAVIVFGLIELMSVPGGGHTAHLAHLGGMLFGWLFLLWSTGGRLGRIPRVPRPGGSVGGASSKRGGDPWNNRGGSGSGGLTGAFRRWRTRARIKVVDSRRTRGGDAGSGNGGLNRDDQARIDQILEKISREGLASLTPEEQDILRRASKKD